MGQLDVSDAQMLFKLLDRDHSNEVSIDEFVNGCYKLQGALRSMDVKIMQCEVKALYDSVANFDLVIADIRDALRFLRLGGLRPGEGQGQLPAPAQISAGKAQ